MFPKNKLASAILSLSGITVAGVASAQIEEIIVTATKRTASMQDVAIAVQALNGENLEQQNVSSFQDYQQLLPSVSSGGRGPGQNTVFIRGMSVNQISTMLSGAQGTMPNVALYLDEAPVTAPGRNLDVYVTDMERIEVLPGPQGTLFGASSQAGTVRLITKKPQLGEFAAGLDASISTIKDGGQSNSVEAYINVPVIDDKLAVRAAFYNDTKGGYIDNVEGEKQLSAGNPAFPAGAQLGTARNTALVEEDFNDAFYTGARLGARYVVDDDWEALLQYTHQDLGADGVFDYDPAVGDLKVQRYFPDELDDRFDQIAWTLKGRLGMLNTIYTGAYLDREIEQTIDYTGYSDSGAFVPYYICDYPAYTSCTSPEIGFQGFQQHERVTHEIRVSTPDDKRLSAVVGVYYDDLEIETIDNYLYLINNSEEFAQNAPISGSTAIDPNPRPPQVGFFNDITRTEEQVAVFGELYVDLTDSLELTLGARYYDMESDFTGSSNFTPLRGGPDDDRGRDYDVAPHSTEPLQLDDFIPKTTMTYRTDNDLLFYATYSEGFRPGGFNRGGGLPARNPTFDSPPVNYGTDDVTNFEFGWKTTLLDGAVRWNGALYYIEWEDMQISRFDPINIGILTYIDNAADAEIAGLETDLTWAVSDNLMLFGAVSYNDTELVDTLSSVIELVPLGSALPLTPEFQASARARYTWEVAGLEAYWQLSARFADDTTNSLVAAEARSQDSYVVSNFRVGVNADDGWGAELFVENLADERAELSWNTADDSERVTTNLPRSIGLKVSYDFR